MFSCVGGITNPFLLTGDQSSFEIILENCAAHFHPGEKLVGVVVFINSHPKECKNIVLTIHGNGRSKFTKTDGRTTRSYSQQEAYLIETKTLEGCEHGTFTIQEGTYRYPFTFALPSGLPSTFSHLWESGWEYGMGKISYYLEVEMKRPWNKTNLTKRLPFTFQGILNLHQLSCSQPVSVYKGKHFYDLFCQEGLVTLTFKINKTGFAPGENIKFTVHLDNGTSMTLPPPKVKLLQIFEYSAEGRTAEEVNAVAEMVYRNQTGSKSKLRWESHLTIPWETLITNFGGSPRLIRVQYTLRFEQKMPLLWKKFYREIGITIGSRSALGLRTSSITSLIDPLLTTATASVNDPAPDYTSQWMLNATTELPPSYAEATMI